jgi:hypothetical protein
MTAIDGPTPEADDAGAAQHLRQPEPRSAQESESERLSERLSEQLWRPRWSGKAGRLEVWYATFTDAESGAGLWVHGETLSPTSGSGAGGSETGGSGTGAGGATSHGWAAWFPSEGQPVWARTGTCDAVPVGQGDGEGTGFRCPGLDIDTTGTTGAAGSLEWDLRWSFDSQEPLWTFPRWAWRRELLPAAQVVAAPSMVATGWVSDAEGGHEVSGHAQGARIYGHGNARRWGWLHADLGDGDVIELVTAVSNRAALRTPWPLTFLRLRVGGVEVSRARLACWGLRSTLDLPRWRVHGRTQGLEVDIEVDLPEDRIVSIDYTDPDGSTAVCTNSERADAVVTVTDQRGRRRCWTLDGTAHAEIGTRP